MEYPEGWKVMAEHKPQLRAYLAGCQGPLLECRFLLVLAPDEESVCFQVLSGSEVLKQPRIV